MVKKRFIGLGCLASLALATFAPCQPDSGGLDSEPRLTMHFGVNMRFGLKVVKDSAGKSLNKQLTFSPASYGWTNTTVIKLDGKDMEYGGAAGKWVEKETKIANGSKSVWVTSGVEIAQILEVVPSQQPVEVEPGVRKRLLDTCLIRYVIDNKDSQDHAVGLRILVDTLIGTNDGVPFTVPGLPGLVNTFKDFKTPNDVPEFIQALEVPDLLKPGTVGHMTLKVGGGLEAPNRVSLTRWPGPNFAAWEVPVMNMGSDSAVIIYWSPDPLLKSGAKRSLGFAYGLGKVSSAEGTGKLALTVNGSFIAGETFTVTAYVQDPVADQTLSLDLPTGLERVSGKPTEQVPPASADAKKTSVITWKVKATQAGQYVVNAKSSTGVSQSEKISIRPGNSGGGAGKLLALKVAGPLLVNQVFTLTTTVKDPQTDQTLTLELPDGLARAEGDAKQNVPSASADDGESAVVWKIKADKKGPYTLTVRSSTDATLTKDITITGPKTDLNVLDARKALQMSVGNLAEDLALDVDVDGRVTSLDAALILQRVADQTRQGK